MKSLKEIFTKNPFSQNIEDRVNEDGYGKVSKLFEAKTYLQRTKTTKVAYYSYITMYHIIGLFLSGVAVYGLVSPLPNIMYQIAVGGVLLALVGLLELTKRDEYNAYFLGKYLEPRTGNILKVVAFTLFSIVSSSYGGYVGTFEAMDNSKSIVAANVSNVDSINNGFALELAEIDATIKEVRNQKSNRWTGHLKAQTLSDLGIQKAEIKQRQTSTLLGLKSGMESDKAKDKSTANKEAYLIAFVVVALEIILLFVYNSLWAIHSKIHIEGENLGYILHPSEPTIKIQKSLNTPTQLVASKDAKVGFGSNTPQQSEPTQQKPKPVQVTKCKQPKCNVILDPYKVDRYQKKYCSDPCRLGDYNRRQYEKRISK